MPRLQIKLLNKSKAIIKYNKWKRLSLLIFRTLPSWILWRHCICPIVYKQKNLFPTTEAAQWCHEIQDGGTGEI